MENSIDYEQTGIVFNIQRFSLNDGPGLRVIVFLKGCPLSCRWCSNPESQMLQPQVMYNEKNCIKCGNCEETCQMGAIVVDNTVRFSPNVCTNCGDCVETCYAEALTMAGKEMTVREVMTELEKEDISFRYSGGGVTLSGGEPMMQSEFARELLRACKSNGWNTAVETTGYGREQDVQNMMPWCDLVLLDFKHTNDIIHKQQTGVDTQRIHKNIPKILELADQVIARVPVIPGFNADDDSIDSIADYVCHLGSISELHLLPYHRFGVNKYTCLGRPYDLAPEIQPPETEKMEHFKQIVEAHGLHCNIGAH